MNTLKKSPKAVIPKAVFFALLLVIPFVFTAFGFNYGIMTCCFIGLYLIATSGLDIVFGYCGQISMGHAAFFAIGAYGSSMLNKYFGLPVLLTMIIGAVFATLIGALLAYPASKLVFHFLSLATIAFGEIVYQLIMRSPGDITGNSTGMQVAPLSLFGFELNTNTRFYYFTLVCVIVFLVVKTNLVKSRVGRAFIAIRENPHAAEGMGINVRKYKVIAFATSAFFTAFAGAMFAHFVGYISPDTFTYKQSVLFITMLLFGGTASLAGPIIGAGAVLLLNELLRSTEKYQMFIYGFLLLIVIVAMPGGIYSIVQKVIKMFKKKKPAATKGDMTDA